MVEFLSSWAGSITISVIMATILEMILPEGKNQKYIKTIIGIYILFVIISPIITKISNTKINIENILREYKPLELEVSNINTKENIKEIYVSNLKTDITCKLEQMGYNILNIKLELENSYEKIKEISINVKRKEDGIIKKIEIGKVKGKLTSSEISEIKEFLSKTYEVQEKKITVN